MDLGPKKVDSRDALIGVAVLVVLALIFFVIKNAYANWRVRERVAPSRANASGWFLAWCPGVQRGACACPVAGDRTEGQRTAFQPLGFQRQPAGDFHPPQSNAVTSRRHSRQTAAQGCLRHAAVAASRPVGPVWPGFAVTTGRRHRKTRGFPAPRLTSRTTRPAGTHRRGFSSVAAA